LIAQGWRVDGIDLATARRRRLPAGMDVRHLDLGSASNLPSIVVNYDGILHLAGFSRVGDAHSRPLEAIRANIMGTANLLEAMRRAQRPPWMLFASSLEVNTDASGAYGLTNMYGLTKAASELLSHRYAADYGLVVAAARIAGIYGSPDDNPDKVPLVFALRALEGKPLRVAAGQRLMRYIHIDDVSKALISAMRQLMRIRPPAFCVLDFRAGRKIGLEQLARLVCRKAGATSPIESFTLPASRELIARNLTLQAPQVSLEQGLAELMLALRRADRKATRAPRRRSGTI